MKKLLEEEFREKEAARLFAGSRAGDKIKLFGKRFGRLVVTGIYHCSAYAYARCKCDCGKRKTIAVINIVKGRTKSCGCLRQEYYNRGN